MALSFGIIVGNRGFFPDHLAKSGRDEMIATVEGAGYGAVCLTPEQSKYGAVESREDAKRCAALFRENQDKIAGIIVTLPNFGEERTLVEAIRMADLNVPVLVQATPDNASKMTIADRRDSFCGKMSACNNMQQYRIKYSLTTLHTEAPGSPEFLKDLHWFAAVCRVANGLKKLRIGAIGARPAAFNTVRYSEKMLEGYGISIEPLDLSEVFGRIEKLKNDEAPVQEKLAAIRNYVDTSCCHRSSALQDGEARSGDRPLDGRQRSGHQRHPVLDVDGRVLRRGSLHRDEHDEQRPAFERLRSGRPGRDRHACAAPGIGNAERAARLEQQLRRRSGQGRLLPLQQPAEALLPERPDGLPGDHRRDGGQAEHLRHLRRPCESRAI